MAFNDLTTGTKSAAVLVMVVAFVLAILQALQTSGTLGTDTVAANAVDDGSAAIATVITWVGIVILMIVAVWLFKKMKDF